MTNPTDPKDLKPIPGCECGCGGDRLIGNDDEQEA